MRFPRRSRARWLWVAALAICCAGLVACGASKSTASNVVEMGVADFQQHSVTIQAGQSVHFDDPVNGGGTHIICIGKGQSCVPTTGAPAELNTADGITFNAGDPAKDIVFPTAGTYDVVCTIHPGMVVTVTVH